MELYISKVKKTTIGTDEPKSMIRDHNLLGISAKKLNLALQETSGIKMWFNKLIRNMSQETLNKSTCQNLQNPKLDPNTPPYLGR